MILSGLHLECYWDGSAEAAVDVPVVASGGVATARDVARLADVPMAGCIIGRALYEQDVILLESLDRPLALLDHHYGQALLSEHVRHHVPDAAVADHAQDLAPAAAAGGEIGAVAVAALVAVLLVSPGSTLTDSDEFAAATARAAPVRISSSERLTRSAGRLRSASAHAAAIELLKRAQGAHPESELVALALARAYVDDGNDFWALNSLAEFTRQHPPACESRAYASWIHLRQANLDQAQELLDGASDPPASRSARAAPLIVRARTCPAPGSPCAPARGRARCSAATLMRRRRCSFLSGVNGEALLLQMISAPPMTRLSAGEEAAHKSSQISALTMPL